MGRLHYELVSGTGPISGWVSTKIQGKDLLIKAGDEADAERDGEEVLLRYVQRFGHCTGNE